MKSTNFVFKEVIWQRPFQITDVEELLIHLFNLGSRSFLVWEVCFMGKGNVKYFIGGNESTMYKVVEILKTHGNITVLDSSMSRRSIATACSLNVSHSALSLNTDVAATVARSTLAAMSGTRNETAMLQIIIGEAIKPKTIPTHVPDPEANFIEIIRGQVKNATPEQRKRLKEKSEQINLDCVVRVGTSGEYAKARLNHIITALRTLESAGVRFKAKPEAKENIENRAIPWRLPVKLSIKELASLMLLPVGDAELPSAPGLHPKLLTPPSFYLPPSGDGKDKTDRTFAVSVARPNKRLSISPRDSLTHTILAGPTGVGKSTAMLNLVLADINAGRSVLVLDPKQDLVTSILERIPKHRLDDVVVLSPSDVANPTGFNPFAIHGDPGVVADMVLSVFEEIFATSWGIRSTDIFGSAFHTLARTKGANLMWLVPLLTDPAFRQKVTAPLEDTIGLVPFWKHYEEMRPSERRTEIASVLNKVRQLTLRPQIRNMLGQSYPKFSLDELFTKRKIVLVPLNQGVIGQTAARLLGSLIIGTVWSLTLSRANIAPEKRHIVSVFIDEAHNFLNLPLPLSAALAESRGLGVGWTLACQYRNQMTPELKSAIDANTRNKIVFGLNAKDAKGYAAQAEELEAIDFMKLPRFEVYTRIMANGKDTGWISGKTLPPPPPLRLAAELRARSQTRYGIPAEKVEKELTKIYNPKSPVEKVVSSTPIGRKKRSRKQDETSP